MIDDALALIARVAALGNVEAQTDFLTFIGGRIGTLAESYARAYPPEPNGRPLELFYTLTSTAKKPYTTKSGQQRTPGGAYQSKFKSLKQNRKVVILMKNGPRTRTGQLGNSITHHVTVAGGGIVVAVGTNLSYAEWVIGAEGVQNRYHDLTGWQRLGETIAAHTEDFASEVVVSGKPWLVDYLKGDK